MLVLISVRSGPLNKDPWLGSCHRSVFEERHIKTIRVSHLRSV